MDQQLARQIKGLQIYAGILTIVVFLLGLLFFLQARGSRHFKEIDAERINIVEKDGRLRMVISDQKEQHPGAIAGKTLPPRDRPAGIIFFNDDGDECGGLIYDGTKGRASMTYSIDQYKNDQIMQLQYSQDSSLHARSYGLKMWDRSDDFRLAALVRLDDSLKGLHDTAAYRKAIGKLDSGGFLGRERLYLGKTKDKQVGLFLRDSKGVLRVRIGLDSLNRVVFETYDDQGHVTALTSAH